MVKILSLPSISSGRPAGSIDLKETPLMTALIGRRGARVAAVLSGTALTAAVVAGMAGSASALPGPPMPPPPGPGIIQVDPVAPGVPAPPVVPGAPAAPVVPGVPAPPVAPGAPAAPVAPGEPVLCHEIDPTGPVVITPADDGGAWVTIERELPPGAVPAVPLEHACVAASVR
ncbi:hypothetical protein GCM10023319_06060 [Nocardia iowensis]